MQPIEHTANGATRWLTRLARPTILVGEKPWPAFVFFAGVGFVGAAGLGLGLALHRGLSPGLMAGLGVLAIGIVAGLDVILQTFAGKERLVYYHSFLAILVGTALFLRMADRPILPHLEVLMLGLGLLQALGRIGCFMVGCCHGRPHAWGVCYRRGCTAAGFDRYLVGVPLAPVQLMEMLWALGSVVAGSALVLASAAPGSGFSGYVILYSAGRFVFEFLRGDPERAYAGGFSEAQWTSLLMITAVVCAGWGGLLPAYAWHQGVGGGVLVILGAVIVARQSTSKHRLLHPRHVGEVARALHVLHAGTLIPRSPGAPAHVVRTSLGVHLSGGAGRDASGPAPHYAMSRPDGAMKTGEARALAGLIRQLMIPVKACSSSIE